MSDRPCPSSSQSDPVPMPRLARGSAGTPAGVPVGAVAAACAAAALAALLGGPPAAKAQTTTTTTTTIIDGRGTGGYTGYGGTRWSTDYGIGAGRCDRDAMVVEQPAGGQTLVQRHEQNLRNRSVGVIGATQGSGLLLSTRLGGRLDERDRRCLGHVLELGSAGQQVGWTNGTTRQTYAVAVTEYTPPGSIPSASRPGAKERCRVLLLTTAGTGGGGGRPSTETLVACQANPGVWSIR